MANRLKQGGYENTETYKNIKSVEFGGIDNIHAVRQAYKNTLLHCTTSDEQQTFWTKIESFKWLEYIQKIVQASSEIAQILKDGRTVLIHCTDGWDRTA